MKKAFLFLALCMLAIPRIEADAPVADKAQVEAFIASIPTPNEWERWKSMTDKQKKSFTEKKFLKKIEDAEKNIKKLESVITAGRPLSDYPGLLSAGTMEWDKEKNIYTLRVRLRFVEDYYGGFTCVFDSCMTITKKAEIVITL